MPRKDTRAEDYAVPPTVTVFDSHPLSIIHTQGCRSFRALRAIHQSDMENHGESTVSCLSRMYF